MFQLHKKLLFSRKGGCCNPNLFSFSFANFSRIFSWNVFLYVPDPT